MTPKQADSDPYSRLWNGQSAQCGCAWIKVDSVTLEDGTVIDFDGDLTGVTLVECPLHAAASEAELKKLARERLKR